MKTVPVAPLPLLDTVSTQTLKTLAKFSDEASNAVTLYFSCSTFPNRTHREEALTIQHLVDTAKSESSFFDARSGLSRDLAKIHKMEPTFRYLPGQFRAIFACSDKQIWQEVNLPLREHIARLNISNRFHLVPLLRALEACIPYCVVIIEHGKARSFMIRGTELDEINTFPSAEKIVNAGDSRTGWSKHIDGNIRERAKAYFKLLAHDLHKRMQELSCQRLIVGCREDLWPELEPQFDKVGIGSIILGRFHISSFDIKPSEVVEAVRPIVIEKQRQQYAAFWENIREEPALSAVGLEPVLRNLESGRVQPLFLGDISGRSVTECSNCTKWLQTDALCPTCGNSYTHTLPAEELLLRKALSTGANIVVPDFSMATSFGEVGALLRH